MKLKQIVFGTFSLLILVSCGNKKQGQTEKQLDEYEVMRVSLQQAQSQATYPVTIKGKEDIDIKPRVDGFIEAIYVDEGSIVKKGQILFKINSPQSEQALVSAKASYNTAKVNVDRVRPLVEKGILSTTRLEMEENTYQSAKAVLKNAEEAKAWANVTSPVDGIVGRLSYRLGSLVDKSNVLTSVANVSEIYAYFSLNEKSLLQMLGDLEGNTQSEKIKNMPEITLVLSDGTVYGEKGKVETIAGVVDVTTGAVNFRAKFPNKEGLLRSGTSGKAIIPQHLGKLYVIPQKSTFTIQDKVLVYKVQADSVLQTVVTTIPLADGKNYAVQEGLREGDQIVVDGIAKLQNGSKIRIKQ